MGDSQEAEKHRPVIVLKRKFLDQGFIENRHFYIEESSAEDAFTDE